MYERVRITEEDAGAGGLRGKIRKRVEGGVEGNCWKDGRRVADEGVDLFVLLAVPSYRSLQVEVDGAWTLF